MFIEKIQPVDLFPATQHVESVCLLVRKDLPADTEYAYVDYEVPEDIEIPYDATYLDIRDWVLRNYGLKVSSLFISQVKDKCGLEKERNGNNENRKKTGIDDVIL